MKYHKEFYEVCERVRNDPVGTPSWAKHFDDVMEATVNREIKSWRDAHADQLKNVEILGAECDKLEKKLKSLKANSRGEE